MGPYADSKRFPGQIISHAFWLYVHSSCSHRDVEALLCARGVNVSSIAIGTWGQTGGASCTPPWRRCPQLGHTWHLDKVCSTINTVQEAHARHCSRAQTRGRAACRRSPTSSRRTVRRWPRPQGLLAGSTGTRGVCGRSHRDWARVRMARVIGARWATSTTTVPTASG